jgi:hypothetical protein
MMNPPQHTQHTQPASANVTPALTATLLDRSLHNSVVKYNNNKQQTTTTTHLWADWDRKSATVMSKNVTNSSMVERPLRHVNVTAPTITPAAFTTGNASIACSLNMFTATDNFSSACNPSPSQQCN